MVLSAIPDAVVVIEKPGRCLEVELGETGVTGVAGSATSCSW